MMKPFLHQRLINQATMHGTGEVMRRMTVEYSPDLEFAIRQGVRQAVLYYAGSLDSWSRQHHLLEHGKRRA